MRRKPTENKDLFYWRDVLAYFFVAGTGLLVQLVSAHFIYEAGYEYQISITIGYIIAFVVGFWLTKIFAFSSKQPQKTRREMVKYIGISAFAGGVMVAFANLTLDIINVYFPTENSFLPSLKQFGIKNPKELFSHISGAGFSFVTNYIGHKTITFKSTGFYDRIKAYIK
ncbi:MAG: GtrA family protein [Spirosomataceae bacterium]